MSVIKKFSFQFTHYCPVPCRILMFLLCHHMCNTHCRAASGGHSYMCSALIQQGVMVDACDKEG